MNIDPAKQIDVAIIGGGPAGSTAAAILKKYNPALSVAIFERERFPRDHVGESLLPLINEYLEEMGVWDKVEAANFPIKVGATYRWGATSDLWNFEFLPNADFRPASRPSKLEGQRRSTSFQVDRAVYDKVLLDHARALGCQVFEQARVLEVGADGDAVTGIGVEFEHGEDQRVSAKYYVDASGASGILRRAMKIGIDSPSNLRNVAVWAYWRNAEWAVKIGVGGTRIQVLSLGFGWLWFIPIGPDRTSIGLVVPAEYLKASGHRSADLYEKALQMEPRLASLIKNATMEPGIQTTSDWSYVSERLCGSNWFLAGDSCGFADPILSAGCTLAHASGREVAYAILALLDPAHVATNDSWIKTSFEDTHRRRILQHIRFADYWYSANGQFTDLLAYCSEIAAGAGLDLDPDEAFRWLGTGGFANDDLGQASVGAYTLAAVKRITQLFAGKRASWRINGVNNIRLELKGAQIVRRAHFSEGRIHEVEAMVQGSKIVSLTGPFRLVVEALRRHSDLRAIAMFLRDAVPQNPAIKEEAYFACLMALEAMLSEGWAIGSTVKGKAVGLRLPLNWESATIKYDRSSVPV